MSADEVREIDPGEWVTAVTAARDSGFDLFDWLTGVDRTYDEAAPGFEVVVRLLDVSAPGAARGILLKTLVAEGDSLPSLTGVFAGAAWHERETHEMFGVAFSGFDDGTGLGLRPLLLPDGFSAHPLRKDFQLAARASKAWPGGKEPGEGHDSAASPSRRRVQAPGVPPPEWGPRA